MTLFIQLNSISKKWIVFLKTSHSASNYLIKTSMLTISYGPVCCLHILLFLFFVLFLQKSIYWFFIIADFRLVLWWLGSQKSLNSCLNIRTLFLYMAELILFCRSVHHNNWSSHYDWSCLYYWLHWNRHYLFPPRHRAPLNDSDYLGTYSTTVNALVFHNYTFSDLHSSLTSYEQQTVHFVFTLLNFKTSSLIREGMRAT